MSDLPRTPRDAARAFDDAFNARDWDRLGELVADDLTLEDRRPGFGNTLGKDEHVANHRTWAEISPDARATSELLHDRGRATLWRITYSGHDTYGNPVENRILVVNRWDLRDDSAIACTGMVYDEDQEQEAIAETDRLASHG